MAVDRVVLTDVEAVACRGDGLQVLRSVHAEDWNAYLERTGPGRLFCQAEWEAVFAFYGMPSYRLAAVRNEQIVGVLPLVWQRSVVFGNQLSSLPWFDTAGLWADDEPAAAALIEDALRLARACQAKWAQLRQTEPIAGAAHVRTDKVLMRLALPSDPEALWKDLSPKVRNQVRKGQKCGLTVEQGGAELLDSFHQVYARNMRDLGSPPHHRRFFDKVAETFPNQTRVYVVRVEGRPIGVGLTMDNGDRLEIPWASSLQRFNSYCVNHVMYWQILQDACRRGFRWFHFGRSTIDSGPYRFKKQWGAEAVPLYWSHLAADGDKTMRVESPQESYGWGTRLWRRLPVWVASRLGPAIIAKVP